MRAGEHQGGGGGGGDGGGGGEVVGHGSPLAMLKLMRFPLIMLLCVNVIWVAFIAGAIQPTFEPRLRTVRVHVSAFAYHLFRISHLSPEAARDPKVKSGNAQLKQLGEA